MFYEQEYDRHLASTGRMASTRRVHRYTLGYLKAFLERRGITDPKAVTQSHVIAFAGELTVAELSAKAVAGHLMRVRIYFRFLEGERLVFLSPVDGLRMPRVTGGRRCAYRDEELAAAFDRLDVSTDSGLRARAILEVAYSAALRPREIRALKLCDVDRAGGMLFIEQSKNLKDRLVPVGSLALEWLDRYVETVRSRLVEAREHPFVFASHKSGRRLSASGLVWAVRCAFEEADAEAIPLSAMRLSAATNMLDAGMGVMHISRLLGHASIRTTQHYLHTRERELALVLESHHPAQRQRREGVPA